MNNELIRIRQIYKQFSNHTVLKGIDLTLHKGEVFAIVGGNGAGKSTLMKIITGLYRPDEGEMMVEGKDVSFQKPADAHKHGIYLVPQEPLIFPNMTIRENITIGLKESKAECTKRINDYLSLLGWKLDLGRKGLTLSIAEQQLVELLRGLVRNAKILILDEPTSTLTFSEIHSLFATIKKLTSEGLGVFYITHRLTEIFELADAVAVLRDGIISSMGKVKSYTHEKLLEGLLPEKNAEVGAASIEPLDLNASRAVSVVDRTKPILTVKNLCGNRFDQICFELFPGEILGIAGVVGAGRTELASSIFGLSSWESGEVLLDQENIHKLSIRGRINRGLVYVPEDRYQHGIFSIGSIKMNITSTTLQRNKGFFLPFKKEKAAASRAIERLKVAATGQHQLLSQLSGGNQQKVVLSKYLEAGPKVMMLDEPTRGIDAGARGDIYQIIDDLRDRGLAVILISSDMEEIVQLCDRVLVMHEGKVASSLDKKELTVDSLTSAAFGIQKELKVQ
ncbi:sugar ABC transporter ATP-binding protein [Falsibacillus albus]|uniref:Autoinducer 2 import ATP-binding protein LsrA n=1 Tax=Falsibacillus albus TaxID=2478915 RepID=A0A3L7JVZ2_9BACI|nr:ATP-binding cassette domain-containing protein [Falsibacillus albus]RLQ94916.1 ATP-binding cassette domain-containing protein [Falsibacillus albus]